MPLEVRIDVVPHGIEAARKTLRIITITQVEKLDDDPGGERIYEVRGTRTARIQHARKDGAGALAAKALSAYFGGANGRRPNDG